MIGRRRQLQLVLQAIENTFSGSADASNVLIITGEAGIGKTTLLRTVKEYIEEHGGMLPSTGQENIRHSNAAAKNSPILMVTAECSTPLAGQDIGEVEALKPWIDLMEQLLRVKAERQANTPKTKMKFDFGKFFMDTAPSWLSLIPVVGTSIGAAVEIVGAGYNQMYLHNKLHKDHAVAAAGSQEQLFQQYINFLAKVAEETPLALVLDDFHWADTSSSNLLFAAARQLRSKPILFIVAYRSDDAISSRGGTGHPILHIRNELGRYSMYEEVQMPSLTREDLDTLLKNRYRNYQNNPEFETWLAEVSGGNALFITQFLNMLEEDEIVAGDGTIRNSYEDVRVPQSAYSVVRERIRRLSEEAKELLRYGSVEGSVFTSLVLSKLSERALLKLLQALRLIEENHGVIKSLGKQLTYAHESTTYQFGHTLIQRVLYEGLEEEEREILHQMVVEVLKQEWDTAWQEHINVQGIAARLSSHCTILGDHLFAASVLLEGAKASWRNFAEEETLRLLQSVEASINSFLRTASIHQKEAHAHKVEDISAEAAMLQGLVCKFRGRYDEALGCFRQARMLFEKSNKTSRAIDAMVREAFVLENKGSYHEAESCSRTALVLAEQTGDKKAQGAMLNNIGLILLALGRNREALDYQLQSLAIREEIHDLIGQAVSLGSIGLALFAAGEYAEALEHHKRSFHIREQLNDRVAQAYSLTNIGKVLNALGQYDEALLHHVRSVEIRKTMGDRAGESASLHNIGDVLLNMQRLPEALEYYQRSLTLRQGMGHRAGEAISLCRIGGIYRRLGDRHKSREALEHALFLARETGARPAEAECTAELGLLYKADAIHVEERDREGRLHEALAHLEMGVRLFREVKHPDTHLWEKELESLTQRV